MARSRKGPGCIGYLIGIAIVIVVLSVIGSNQKQSGRTGQSSGSSQSPSASQANPTTSPHPQTALDRFPAVASYLSGDNNDSPPVPRLRGYNYDPKRGIVNVDFAMNQNLTQGMMRDGIKIDMSTIYTDIFHDGSVPVQTVHIVAWGPFQDQYGNSMYAPAYATTLTSDIADRINWNLDQSVLNLNIIPGLWTVTYSQPSMGF